MDGNNRWSKKNTISKYKSYKIGAEKILRLSNYIFSNTDVDIISAFALSSNNLQRSSGLINVIKKVLYDSLVEINKIDLNFNIRFIGNLNILDSETKKAILNLNNRNDLKKKLLIYLNYGGREDIEQAAKKNNKSIAHFKNNLITNKISDPDILIRTGGYNRLSNFLLYQLAFTEIFFVKKLWPDFNTTDLKKLISKFYKIERKFGR